MLTQQVMKTQKVSTTNFFGKRTMILKGLRLFFSFFLMSLNLVRIGQIIKSRQDIKVEAGNCFIYQNKKKTTKLFVYKKINIDNNYYF